MSKEPEDIEDKEFMAVLEDGVRQVLKNRKASSSERVAAINVGAKLLAIRHRITGGDEDNFFK